MTRTSTTLLLWGPRFAGILMAAFLSLFALDAFDGRPLVDTLPAFAIHLIPSFLVLAVVAIAWKFEWVGAVVFMGLAVAYAVMVRWRIDWIAAISGPLVIVAVLFLVSWRHHGDLHAAK
jgi:glucose-6-phosphate-specific signal transduction histidine kinase